MTVQQAISSVTSLSPQDQLLVVQAIWDALPEAVTKSLNEKQREEMDRRWQLYESDPNRALTEEEFRSRVRNASV